ncbi:MAG: hypothetical protein GW763_11345 [Paraglaciecola sp.]|nr:hypothetical protein [Paraglaciecola sp.]
MKGKKTIDSLKDAAATEVANGKIEITNLLNVALTNMATIRELAPGHKHLFNDWPSIAFKANDDFTALVKTRLIDEQARIDAERAKIRAEEEAKAKADAEVKILAEQAEIARNQAPHDDKAEALRNAFLEAEGKYEESLMESKHSHATTIQQVTPAANDRPLTEIEQAYAAGFKAGMNFKGIRYEGIENTKAIQYTGEAA